MNNIYISKIFQAYTLLLIVVCLSSDTLFAQNIHGKIDSLQLLLKKAASDTSKVKILKELSNATDCADTFHKAGYARQSLQLAKSINWQKGVARANFQLGMILEDCFNDYNKAIKYFQDAAAAAAISEDTITRAYALGTIANSYKILFQYSKALEYYRNVLALDPAPDISCTILGNMGEIYANVGDYPSALACYDSSCKELDRSIRSAKTSDITDTLSLSLSLMNIGDIYLQMKDIDMALKNYNEALALSEQTQQRSIRIDILKNIARTYSDKKDFAKAIEYSNKALAESKETANKKGEAIMLDQLGNTYLLCDSMKEALGNALQALKLAEEINYMEYIPNINNTLGKIYTKLGNYPKAIEHLKTSIDICKKNGALDMEQEDWSALSIAYEQARQPVLALDAYRQYTTIKDSLYSISKTNEIIRMDLKSDYERKKNADSYEQAKKDSETKLRMQRQNWVMFSSFAGILLLLGFTFFMSRNNKLLSKEKKRSDTLLLNILPAEVAAELKDKGVAAAKYYDNVTVLLTDFVNFTNASERMTPQGLIDELHTCFKTFDDITEKYNIEKIKTIGDAYLAACGLPLADPKHAENVVNAAIEIATFMRERHAMMGDKTFQIRIGVHSGSVVAGIVGVKKFAYDIWGDTVNTAARMEQNSATGRINISETTYTLVKDKFSCTYRGELEAKNKGMMKMYFVDTRNA